MDNTLTLLDWIRTCLFPKCEVNYRFDKKEIEADIVNLNFEIYDSTANFFSCRTFNVKIIELTSYYNVKVNFIALKTFVVPVFTAVIIVVLLSGLMSEPVKTLGIVFSVLLVEHLSIYGSMLPSMNKLKTLIISEIRTQSLYEEIN